MPNPLVSQGSLNRIQGSISVPNYPSLNVTAAFLGKAGISLALEGEATHYIGTMTGAVTSPEVYMVVRVTGNLLKTQALSDAYKTQMELDSRIGSITVRPDLSAGTGLSPYVLTNCAIMSVRELNFSGEDAGYVVEITGYYNVNSDIWNG